MRVLGPIVQISALSVLDALKKRFATLVAQGLNEDVEQDVIPIDGTPEIVLHVSVLRMRNGRPQEGPPAKKARYRSPR